jgi:Kelch motif
VTPLRRLPVLVVAVVLISTVTAACRGNNDRVDAGPTTSRPGRFPAAVVSTTTPTTTAGAPGTTIKGKGGVTTTTVRRPTTGTTAAPTTTPVPAGRTKPNETPLPVARNGVAGTAWQGLVVVAGGVGAGGSPSVRVDAYDPKTGQWASGPHLPVALTRTTLAVLGEDLWVVGGLAQEGDQLVAQSKTYRFHPGDTAWKAGPELKAARGAAAAATLGNFLVVLGGETSDGTVLDSVEVLANRGSEWKSTQPLAFGRSSATALAMNGRIYAAGGKTASSTAVNSVESWRSGAPGWRTESRLDSDRTAAAGAATCVAGGINNTGIVATIECFGTGFWVVQGRMRVPRHGLAAVALDGWLHLIGGATAGTTVTSTHEVFDLGTTD